MKAVVIVFNLLVYHDIYEESSKFMDVNYITCWSKIYTLDVLILVIDLLCIQG